MFISSCDFGLLHVKSMLILCQIVSLPQFHAPPTKGRGEHIKLGCHGCSVGGEMVRGDVGGGE